MSLIQSSVEFEGSVALKLDIRLSLSKASNYLGNSIPDIIADGSGG